MASGSTTPFATALATAVPARAPTKFIAAAITTAAKGDMTLVETTVAMALAASLKSVGEVEYDCHYDDDDQERE